MRKLRTVLGILDDLLEMLIFDILLATRRRRWVAAGLTGFTGLMLYLVSGILFTPTTTIPLDPVSSAPYIDDATWKSPADVVSQTCSQRTVPAGGLPALEAELEKHQDLLTRVRAKLEAQNPPHFSQVPNFRNVRELGNLLVARGVWRSERGESCAAMRDWLTAARLALVVADDRHRPITLIEGMISTGIERQAMRAIQAHVDAGRTIPCNATKFTDYLEVRARYNRTLAGYLRGERAFAERMLGRARELGCLNFDDGLPRFGNLFMPVRHADRVLFIDGLRDTLARYHDRVAAEALKPSPRSLEEAELDQLATADDSTVRGGPVDFVAALFSRPRAVSFVSRWILDIAHPNIEAAGKRIETLEDEVQAIRRFHSP